MVRVAFKNQSARYLCLLRDNSLGHTRNKDSCLKFNTWSDAIFGLCDLIEAEDLNLAHYEPEEVI